MSNTPTSPNGDQDQDQAAEQGEQEVQGLAIYNAEVLRARPGVEAAFLEMVKLVPEPVTEDASAEIVAQILGAETAGDLDKPWDSDGMRGYFDQQLTVKSITRRKSDYANGLGVYLGCQCVVNATGAEEFITTGGVSAVAQLVRAHVQGWLPLIVVPRRAEKPTSAGYWPYHLEVVARLEPAS